MERTEATVRQMLAAIAAPTYDVGVLSDRRMLPGLNTISETEVLKRLSLLKYRNARGSHIYIRPSGEHRYTVLDDLSEIALAKLAADGFTPCAVVETSAGNFQAWLKHPTVLPGSGAGARGEASAGVPFSPKGTKVDESLSRALPNLEQIPGSSSGC